AGKPEWDWQAPAPNDALIETLRARAYEQLQQAYVIREKQERSQRIAQIRSDVKQSLADEAAGTSEGGFDSVEVDSILFGFESEIVRSQILNGEPRIDGRDT